MHSTTQEPPGLHDFDFLAGEWTVRNRRLVARHAGSDQWDEFSGHAVVRPLLNGLANVDEFRFPTQGFAGSTLRVLNRETGEWSLYWVSDRDGVLLPPVTGHFEAGVGVFYGDDVDGGRAIRVRYVWSNITDRTAHWDQAFSVDQGRTWEKNWTMDLERVGERPGPRASAEEICSPLVELRQYAMKPGRRDDLIAIFEAHFLDGQEQQGMSIIGQFRQLTDPNRFVWFRGFADMDARRAALEGFYTAPIWTAHRAAANDTLEDWSNVLLLRPARPSSGVRPRSGGRRDEDRGEPGVVLATIYTLTRPADGSFVDLFETRITPSLRAAGARLLGAFVTESATNTYPRLPVREDVSVFIWLGSFASLERHAAFEEALANDEEWMRSHRPALEAWLAGPPETLVLAPTERSRLRHGK